MALGGVEIGSEKAKLQPIAVASTGIRGETLKLAAIGIIIGINKFEAAVFETNSVKVIVKTIRANKKIGAEFVGIKVKKLSPITFAKPVTNIIFPSAIPEPNKSSVPQSIFAASSQRSADFFTPNGNKKSSIQVERTTIDSGNLLSSHIVVDDLLPKIRLPRLGVSQPSMVKSKTKMTTFSLEDNFPKLASCFFI